MKAGWRRADSGSLIDRDSSRTVDRPHPMFRPCTPCDQMHRSNINFNAAVYRFNKLATQVVAESYTPLRGGGPRRFVEPTRSGHNPLPGGETDLCTADDLRASSGHTRDQCAGMDLHACLRGAHNASECVLRVTRRSLYSTKSTPYTDRLVERLSFACRWPKDNKQYT